MTTMIADLAPTALAVALLALVTAGVLMIVRAPRPWTPVIAIARGIVQLAILSVILTGIIASPVWIACALVVMFTVASVVAARRLGGSRQALLQASTSIAAGVLVATTIVFGTGALELTPRYALALGAIIIGNAMSIATLTGRSFLRGTDDHWDEVEGWLALGAAPRTSTLRLARQAVHDALVPSIDQTKTTGLVVLPGAFVGAVFGGISPLEAGRFQIVVLAAILAAGSITAVLLATWLGPVKVRPVAPV